LKQQITNTLGDAGLQQALTYGETLDIPLAFSSNGDGFTEHDRSGYRPTIERKLQRKSGHKQRILFIADRNALM